jgi:hypothetical protein
VSSSAEVPDVVDDSEDLARRCDAKALKKPPIRGSIFVRTTNFPAEISTDRAMYCKPEETARRETDKMGRPRAYVLLSVRRIRHELPRLLVKSVKPPEEHAEIHTLPGSALRLETKTELEEARLWKEHATACDDLAKLARPPSPPA